MRVKGFPSDINALSALVFLFSMLLGHWLLLYYHVRRRKQHEKTLFIPNWDCPCHSGPTGELATQIEASINTKNSDKLVIYNWGDYIDPELLKEFTKETGIQVQYDTFDSNEAMYTKIKQGGTTYDIAIPSEYMIAKMMDEDLVEKLDQVQD